MDVPNPQIKTKNTTTKHTIRNSPQDGELLPPLPQPNQINRRGEGGFFFLSDPHHFFVYFWHLGVSLNILSQQCSIFCVLHYNVSSSHFALFCCRVAEGYLICDDDTLFSCMRNKITLSSFVLQDLPRLRTSSISGFIFDQRQGIMKKMSSKLRPHNYKQTSHFGRKLKQPHLKLYEHFFIIGKIIFRLHCFFRV